MVIAGAVVFVLGILIIWLVVRRGSRTSAITRDDFDDRYDELVAEGEAEPGDRDAAWNDFRKSQLKDEAERLEQEEETDD